MLGMLVGVYYAASGISQFASGFVVDRLGARPVLLAGIAFAVGGTMLASLAGGVGWLFPVVALMGIGNGVFHPADFAILNANVAPRRIGHAYSAHGIGGNLGFALAPVVSFALGTAFGWRFALAAMGALGFVALGIIALQHARLISHRAVDGHLQTLKGNVALFLQTPIVLCFLYFVFITAGGMGLQTFIPSVLGSGFGVSLALATSTLTAYLLGGTAGILAGGFLAARTGAPRSRRRVRDAGGCGIAMRCRGTRRSTPVAASGFCGHRVRTWRDGAVARLDRPRRDAEGRRGSCLRIRLFGFDLGGIIGPVSLGIMLDHGHSHEVFFAVAACYALGIGTVFRVRRASSRRVALARQVS